MDCGGIPVVFSVSIDLFDYMEGIQRNEFLIALVCIPLNFGTVMPPLDVEGISAHYRQQFF